MAAPSIFTEEKVDLTKYAFVPKIEAFIIKGIKNGTAGVLDRSTVSFQEVSLDRSTLIATCLAKVRAKNSSSAVITVSLTSEFRFKYDVRNQSFFDEKLKIKTKVPNSTLTGTKSGPDIDINIGTIRDVLDGDFAKALELIPNGGLVEREIKSNYDEIHQRFIDKHGEKNVYFASVRFVRFAGLGTVGNWVAKAIVTGGASSAEIMKDVAREAGKELNLVRNWLQDLSTDFIGDLGKKMATEILSGKRPKWPNTDFPDLHFRWQKVIYSSRLKVNSNQVGGSFAENPHAAFVLIWKGSGGSTSTVANQDADSIPLKEDTAETPDQGFNDDFGTPLPPDPPDDPGGPL